MNRIGIYVFSGTGNTLRCARVLKKALEDLSISAYLAEIGTGQETAGERDLVLGYPVHGFNPPADMLRFCRTLPETGGRVWLLKTSGEALRLNEASSDQMVRILKRKGYRVMGEFHYLMPYNMVFRHSDEIASLMWKTAQDRIPEAARQIAEGTGTMPRPGLPSRVMSGICRIEHGFYPVNGRLFRVVRTRCTGCGLCVRDCPEQNIRLSEGRISFGGRCTECARCSFRCPKDAIRIGILDFMRVNGPYDFSKDPAEAVFGRYCRRSYQRYFLERPGGSKKETEKP